MKRFALLCSALVFVSGAGPAQAQPPSAKKAQSAESEILRRLQDLENQVAQYRSETERLKAELAKREAKPAPAATVKSGGGGEWDEPEIERKAEGRDEEARRRLLALETQMRKSSGEAAKLEEERKSRPQFEFSGKYKAQLNSRNNFDLGNPLQKWKYDNATFFDQRFSFQIDAAYESLLARLVLDKGNFVFDWKEDGEGTLERWGQFFTVNSQLVRELFVEYNGAFVLRAGRQNWDVGQNIALEGPMDGIRIQYPFGQLPWGNTTLSAGYMAVAGGWNSYANFIASGGPPAGDRQSVFGASNKLGAWYLDLDIRPGKGLRFKPYLLKVADHGNFGDADLNLDKDFNAATLPRDGGFRPMWTGLNASAELGKWKLDAEAILLTGDYTTTRKLRANALQVKAQRDLGKVAALGNTTFGLRFGRGSGNGTDSTASGTMRNFNGLFMCRERNKFGNIYSEDIRAGYYFWDSNLSNITYLRADLTFEPVKGLKLVPAVARMWTTKSVFAGRGPVFDWSRGMATSTARTRDVGWEFDLDVSYPLYKFVEGFASLGYFRPGEVYQRPDGRSAKSAWEFVLGAEIKF